MTAHCVRDDFSSCQDEAAAETYNTKRAQWETEHNKTGGKRVYNPAKIARTVILLCFGISYTALPKRDYYMILNL